LDGYCEGKPSSKQEPIEVDNATKGDSDSQDNSDHKDGCNDGYKCEFCSKTFTLNHNLKRHLESRCRVKTDSDKRKFVENPNYAKLAKELDDIKTKLASYEDKPQKISVNHNSNNTTNNINSNSNNNTVNIQLVAFGKEDRSKLTNMEILKILNKGYHSVPALLEAIHFDKNKPENHNIYISNDRSSVIHVFDGEKWNAVDKNETISNLFDDGRDFLLTKAEEFNEREIPLTDRSKKMVLKFERFNNDIDEYPVKKNEIITMIKGILYNDRNIPMNTRKQIENYEKATGVLLQYCK